MAPRNTLGGLALAALVAGIAGCSDNKANVSSSSRVDDGQRLRVIGRVINAQTGNPVGAAVEICGLASGSADNNGNFVIELQGNLHDARNNNTELTPTPVTNLFGVKVSAQGHATQLLHSDLSNDETSDGSGGETDPGRNSTMVVNLGTIALNTGFTQSILVTRDGQPLPNVQVMVGSTFNDIGIRVRPGNPGNETQIRTQISMGDFDGLGRDINSCGDIQVATTNSVGVLTFSDLDPFQFYQLFIAAQSIDGDAAPDFQTRDTDFQVLSSGAVFAVNVQGSTFYTSSPEIVGDTTKDLGVGSFLTGAIADTVTAVLFNPNGFNPNATEEQGTNVTGGFDFSSEAIGARGLLSTLADHSETHTESFVTSDDGSVTMVFSSPVQIVQGGNGREVHFTYVDNMSDPRATATYNHRHIVTGTATEVANGLGSLWKFTPSQTIPLYTRYSLQFTGHSAVDPSRVTNYGSDAFNDEGYFRIPTGLSSTINTAVDNYNGATSSTTTAGLCYLEFDRLVDGNYRVVEYTSDNVKSTFDGNTDVRRFFYNNSPTLVNNVNAAPATGTGVRQTGATTGFRYRVFLRDPEVNAIFCFDNTATSKNQIRIAIVAEDIEGNRIDEIRDLDVK